jgi:rSAM/selenodomain-associated transferase 2
VSPTLSIIVPTLDERACIGALLAQLARQSLAKQLEVIVADGGSTDGSAQLAAQAAQRLGLACTVIVTGRGRGAQMNAAVGHARGTDLLFLHADSQLLADTLLECAALTMQQARARRGDDRVAGHFGLQFDVDPGAPRLAYFYYAAKTRLNRPESINGDQGQWIARRYFSELGGYDAQLPYMEDARIARAIFASGEWVSLGGELLTSARRFESEGLYERQTLNALLRCFDAVGMHDYFPLAREAYRAQPATGRLRLGPFLRMASEVFWGSGWRQACRHGWRIGGFVAVQAWQAAFWCDCRRAWRNGRSPQAVETRTLRRFDRWIAPLVKSPPGVALVMAAVLCWFYVVRLRAENSPRVR